MTTWDALPVFEDTFTEGSDTALGSHTPDTGVDWTIDQGSFTVLAASDGLAPITAGFNRATANVSGGISADMAVEIEVDSDVDFSGCIARYTHVGSNSYNGYSAFFRINIVYLYERTGSTFNLLASKALTHGAGDTIRIECDEALENNISLWTDQGAGLVKQVEASDSTHTTGEAGVRASAGEADPWGDNFKVFEKTAAGGARPQGPFGHVFHGPFAGPIG